MAAAGDVMTLSFAGEIDEFFHESCGFGARRSQAAIQVGRRLRRTAWPRPS